MDIEEKEQNIAEGHITLKEAAALSGYAPDYIGQLIRKGRLYGKQVYFKTAWVTTENALLEYIKKEKSGAKNAIPGSAAEKMQRFENRMFSESRLSKFLQVLSYIGIVFSILLCLVLFYILSVNIDHALERRAVQQIESHAQ